MKKPVQTKVKELSAIIARSQREHPEVENMRVVMDSGGQYLDLDLSAMRCRRVEGELVLVLDTILPPNG